MKKIIATTAAAALLLSAAPALAHEGKSGVDATSRTSLSIRVGEWGKEWKENKAEWKKRFEEKRSRMTAGKVISVSGSTLVIDPAGKNPTTTITTDANTVFKINGQATTSAALSVGGKIFAVGTTTATSTSGNTFAASIVYIFTKGFGHLKHWFWFH